jgi:hypothetical protein
VEIAIKILVKRAGLNPGETSNKKGQAKKPDLFTRLLLRNISSNIFLKF